MMCRFASLSLVLSAILVLPGCALDRAGVGGGARDGALPLDAGADAAAIDGGRDDAGGDDGGSDDGGIDGGGIDAGDGGMIIEDDAAVDGGQDAGPPDAGCSGPPTCDGDTLVECVSGGIVETRCPLGCSAASCRAVVPSNVGSAVSFSDGTEPVVVPAGVLYLFYPDDGRIEARVGTMVDTVRAAGEGTIAGIRYARVSGGGGTSHGVFVVSSLHVEENGVLAGNAQQTRSLVIVSAGDVQIDGYVVVRGSEFGPGPGGRAGGAAESDGSGDGRGRRGEAGTPNDGGGGGGSYGTSGGSGGTAGGRAGGRAGDTYGNLTLVPLRGGSGGAGGADGDGGRGGHGGGAIQITSATQIVVSATGGVDAGGEGGRGGAAAFDGGGGGGGGSGGAILLEAITVTLAPNRVGATGGAGGQGARLGANGGNGTDGSIGQIPAAGSSTDGSGGGGGSGSDAGGVAQNGGNATNAGGGGGGAGRIRINNATATGDYMVAPTLASGAASVGMVGRTP